MTAPDRVIVRGPSSDPWEAAGVVVARAPFSVAVEWTALDGPQRAWFNWDPGWPAHGKICGVPLSFAITITEGSLS